MYRKRVFLRIALIASVFVPAISHAQTAGGRADDAAQPTPAQEYQRMLDALHIVVPAAPQAAGDNSHPPTTARSPWDKGNNYDEANANPYPLPDPLLMKDGQRVTDAATWWNKRRPEILSDFQTEIYGEIPVNAPAVTWEVTGTNPAAYGGKVLIRSVTGHIDNSAYPAASPVLHLTLYLPASAAGPVPVMVIVGAGNKGSRSPATQPDALNPTGEPKGAMQQLLDIGWGYVAFDATSLQADSAAGLYSGIIGLVNKGQPRQPDQWGALAAWSWGLSRSIDYLETDQSVDARRLGVEGHSRWGKTAILAAALEPRWAICFASCSGEGGAKPSRRNWGETVDDVAGIGEYYWMAGNFLKYGGHWNDLPVDSEDLIALVAPRPVFMTGGTTDRWADPHGAFLAAVAASPVYQLLGKQGLETTEMPAPDVEIISGDLGFRLHTGGHTDSLDWPTFLKFAQRQFSTQPPRPQPGP